MTAPIVIETELGQALAQIDRKLDGLQKDVTDLKIGQARLEAELTGTKAELKTDLAGVKEDIQEIKGSQKAQIWTLMGVLATAVVGTVIRFAITALPDNPGL